MTTPTTLYPAQFHKDDDKIKISFRDVPEALSQGDDMDDAIKMAGDALATALEFYDERQEAHPTPSAPQHGDVMIAAVYAPADEIMPEDEEAQDQ